MAPSKGIKIKVKKCIASGGIASRSLIRHAHGKPLSNYTIQWLLQRGVGQRQSQNQNRSHRHCERSLRGNLITTAQIINSLICLCYKSKNGASYLLHRVIGEGALWGYLTIFIQCLFFFEIMAVFSFENGLRL